ncbi:unnamed protein product [Ixodes pacificus]
MSLGYPLLMQNWMLSKINWNFLFVPGVRGTSGDVTVLSPGATRHRSVNKVIGSSEVGCHVRVYVASHGELMVLTAANYPVLSTAILVIIKTRRHQILSLVKGTCPYEHVPSFGSSWGPPPVVSLISAVGDFELNPHPRFMRT